MASEVRAARPPLDEVLAASLRVRDEQGLLRRLRPVEARAGALVRVDGRDLVNVASNDYLGLSTHPALAEAAGVAMRDWGSGSAASRLVSGSLAPHHHLEEAIADWQHTEAAIAFSSGFAAASGTIPALVGPGDLVLLDRLSTPAASTPPWRAARRGGRSVTTTPTTSGIFSVRLTPRAQARGRGSS